MDSLFKEAMAALDAQGMDFSQFDGNNDGLMDGVYIHFAGPDTGWGWIKQEDITRVSAAEGSGFRVFHVNAALNADGSNFMYMNETPVKPKLIEAVGPEGASHPIHCAVNGTSLALGLADRSNVADLKANTAYTLVFPEKYFYLRQGVYSKELRFSVDAASYAVQARAETSTLVFGEHKPPCTPALPFWPRRSAAWPFTEKTADRNNKAFRHFTGRLLFKWFFYDRFFTIFDSWSI